MANGNNNRYRRLYYMSLLILAGQVPNTTAPTEKLKKQVRVASIGIVSSATAGIPLQDESLLEFALNYAGYDDESVRLLLMQIFQMSLMERSSGGAILDPATILRAPQGSDKKDGGVFRGVGSGISLGPLGTIGDESLANNAGDILQNIKEGDIDGTLIQAGDLIVDEAENLVSGALSNTIGRIF